MAGLLDGEGTIGITYAGKSPYRSPYISVTSTTPEIVDWLKDNFGGIVCSQKTYQPHHKKSYSWRLRNLSDITELLENTTPYMLEPEKIRRAKLILEIYPTVTRRNGKYSEEQTANKLEFEKTFLGL
jgi:hypothetical protein